MTDQNTAFNVTLINSKKELHKTIKVAADEYILDMAEQEGIKHPSSCRAAACFDCLAKVIEGTVEQTGKALSFLRPHEIKEGYVLLCAASPTSNCTILTHQEEEYLD